MTSPFYLKKGSCGLWQNQKWLLPPVTSWLPNLLFIKAFFFTVGGRRPHPKSTRDKVDCSGWYWSLGQFWVHNRALIKQTNKKSQNQTQTNEKIPQKTMWGLGSLYSSCSLGMSYDDGLGSTDRRAFGGDKFRGGRRWWEVPLVLFWCLLPFPRLLPEIQGWEDLWRARVQSSAQRRVSSGWVVQGFLNLNFSISTEGYCSTISQGHCFGNESLPWQSFSFPVSGWSFPWCILEAAACPLCRARAGLSLDISSIIVPVKGSNSTSPQPVLFHGII